MLVQPDEVLEGAPNSKDFRIIGIGTSAGGLECLKEFFECVPDDCPHSFVIIQHLSPDYKSLMPELLAKKTKLAIREVAHNTPIEKGTIYLIPPKKNMTILDRVLSLTNKTESNSLELPIDIFFKSLAKSEKEKSIGVILSGTGSDGTAGLSAIKDHHGVTFVQIPEEAKFDGMPKSAIQTGKIDYVLPIRDMHLELVNAIKTFDSDRTLYNHIFERKNVFASVIDILSSVSDIDFREYKLPTLIRRIERRMITNRFTKLEDYLDYLRGNKHEVNTLYHEFLIGVTKFFRDDEPWKVLQEQVIPSLVSEKNTDKDTLKVWVVGCSTGEETYSLAILLNEEIAKQNKALKAKIFASDVEQGFLDIAAKGVYPESITEDIFPDWLTTYFALENGKYRVSKDIRRMVIFNSHNVLRDPPFSHMDLVICRNLLIYFKPHAQRKALGNLHYSLKLGGHLLLGSSETVGTLKSVFSEVSRRAKVFQKTKNLSPYYADGFKRSGNPQVSFQVNTAMTRRSENNIAELTTAVITEEIGVVSVHIDQDNNIIDASGEAKKYIQVPQKGFTVNILKMLPESLSLALSTAINKARKQKERVQYKNVSFTRENAQEVVNIFVSPVDSPDLKMLSSLLVVFVPQNEIKRPKAQVVLDSAEDYGSQRLTELEEELKDTRENLQNTIEEVETSNEELQATNEELLAANEELQSTNEELQSVNEELYAVNAEYQEKIEDLAALNDDINNLLDSTLIGTIFLDKELAIRKFTPTITKLFHLREDDIGRPITHFNNTYNIDHQEFVSMINEVQDSGTPKSQEICTHDNTWYLLSINPFVNSKEEVDGTVISYTDITDIKKIEEQVEYERQRFRSIFHYSPFGVCFANLDGFIIDANDKFCDIMGVNEEEVRNVSIASLTEDDLTTTQENLNKLYTQEIPFFQLEKQYRRQDNSSLIWATMTCILIDDSATKSKLFVGIIEDISEKRNTLNLLQRSDFIIQNSNDAISRVDGNGNINYVNNAYTEMLGYTIDDIKNLNVIDIDQIVNTKTKWLENWTALKELKNRIIESEIVTKSGVVKKVELSIKYVRDEESEFIIVFLRDITERKKIEFERKRKEELERKNQELERFVYIASHDLQEPLHTIVAQLEMLKDDSETHFSEDAQLGLKYISSSTTRMSALIRGLLDYSRLGRVDQLTLVDTNHVMSTILADLKGLIIRNEAEITVDQLPSLYVYETHFRLLLQNLISNAIKFKDKNRRSQVHVEALEMDLYWQFMVSDNGIGIDPKHQKMIFEIFKRINKRREYEGTGIGLAHCLKIAELHGGKIWVESEFGTGSKFYFTIPKK